MIIFQHTIHVLYAYVWTWLWTIMKAFMSAFDASNNAVVVIVITISYLLIIVIRPSDRFAQSSLWVTLHMANDSSVLNATGQARWEGEKEGKLFSGPTTFWGPRHRSKILQRVFQMASFWYQIRIKTISGGALPGPRWKSLRRSPIPLDGWWGLGIPLP